METCEHHWREPDTNGVRQCSVCKMVVAPACRRCSAPPEPDCDIDGCPYGTRDLMRDWYENEGPLKTPLGGH